MPKLYNTVTGKWMFMPDSYVGKYPFQTEEEVQVAAEPAPKPAPKKKKATKDEYKPDAIDGDGDGLVQDGTVFQREAGTELTEEEIATRLEEDSE